MKLKDYRPRHPMREVEYFGVKISIPADHEWVATDADGEIYSYSDKPEYSEDTMIWGSDFLDSECPFAVAVAPISTEDAANSLRHYPIEETTNEHQLGLAEAQLLGYAHHRDGYDLAALVDAMGLTPAEWQELQDKYAMHYLSDDDRSVIAQQLKQRE